LLSTFQTVYRSALPYFKTTCSCCRLLGADWGPGPELTSGEGVLVLQRRTNATAVMQEELLATYPDVAPDVSIGVVFSPVAVTIETC
jgi:hypothetical protein